MASPKYGRQKDRSDRINESRDLIGQQHKPKQTCRTLRPQRRHAVQLVKALAQGQPIHPKDYALLRRFESGELVAELNEATRQHRQSRSAYAKQNGNPKVMKLECNQNGLFDANLISVARAEVLWKERAHAKKAGMDKLLEEGRRELAALMVS